jgi:hypothetical protein
LSSETDVGEILARFNTEEQVRAAFLITQACRCKDYPSHRKIFTKTSKHEKHVLQTAQPSRLFYFNNELRLEHNTVERKTNQNIYITSDEKN